MKDGERTSRAHREVEDFDDQNPPSSCDLLNAPTQPDFGTPPHSPGVPINDLPTQTDALHTCLTPTQVLTLQNSKLINSEY